jgi:dTMP kinase
MGFFITFEGGEGTGKSTQVARLSGHLRAKGFEVVQTREPGGTPEAEMVRDLLVNGEPGRWSAEAEALLNYAARDHHLRHLVRPALVRGDWVICDRFMDSTRAYQSHAGGCPESLIDDLEKVVVGQSRPHMTFVFDLDPVAGLVRAGARGQSGQDRFERKGAAFHEKLRQGFLEIARREPKRCKVIDASKDEDAVFSTIVLHLKELQDG